VQQIRHNSVYIVGTNYKRMKTQIVAVRITEKQKKQIKEQAREMGLNSSELVREYIVKLIEHGTRLENNNSYSKA
jgi:post-segregation antitoxin (ccd killing protein)